MTARVETTMKFAKQGAVFLDPVRVQDIGDEYAIESPWQGVSRKIRSDDPHFFRHTPIAESPARQRKNIRMLDKSCPKARIMTTESSAIRSKSTADIEQSLAAGQGQFLDQIRRDLLCMDMQGAK